VLFLRAVDDPEAIRLAWESLEARVGCLQGRKLFGAFTLRRGNIAPAWKFENKTIGQPSAYSRPRCPEADICGNVFTVSHRLCTSRSAQRSRRWRKPLKQMRPVRVSSSTAAVMRSTCSFQ
jgi:hypothetical protein